MRARVVLALAASLSFSALARAQSFAPSEDFDRSETSPNEESSAPADATHDAPAPLFGEAGEVVMSGTAIGSISKTTFDGSDASHFSVAIAPGVDVFLARGVSLGLAVDLRYHDDQGYGADGSLVDTKTSSYGAGPRLGVALPLGRAASFWPQVSVLVAYSRSESAIVSGPSLSIGTPTGTPAVSHVGPRIGAYLPILLHVAPRLFLGFGPTFSHDFAHAIDVDAPSSVSAQQTTFGVALTVGGYAGGPVMDDASAAEGGGSNDDRALRRFGRRGCFVLTNDLSLGGSTTAYSQSDASSWGYGIALGADIFVRDHLSIGAAISDTYVQSTAPSPGSTIGANVDSSNSTFGVGPRIGVEITLDERLSLWPRVGISFGSSHFTSTLGSSKNENTITTTTLTAIAPLLVHVAPHWFAGVGPTLSYDLSGQVDGGRTLRATRIGASGILGGWL